MVSNLLPISKTSQAARITERHIPCDSCGSSDARCNYSDGHGYCYSCATYFPSEDNISEDTFTYEYLPLRGISRETFEFYGARTKIDKDGRPISVGFPYPNSSFKIRTLDEKGFYTKGDIAKAGLFGRNLFPSGSHKYVTITEGELDALSIYQTLHSPCVSVRSSVTALADCSIDRSWLNSFERIYLAFDADEPGRAAAASVARLFDYSKLYDVRFDGSRHKDANDYIRAGEQDELRNVWWNARKFLPDNIKSGFSEFKEILNENPKEGIPYPFSTLNYMTYGIRTGESVLITAQEGVGKTEFCHAIEHQLLTETKDAIGAIYLEEPKKRHLQALAGIQLKRPVHLPDSGTSSDEIFSALQEVVREDDRLHVYSHFGSDDPDTILDTIRFLVAARLCRYILLDHITMVVSGSNGENERRALDYLSTRLEMMVKELDFALILVSHVNDDGLTRGSRNISKIADIRIDLARDLTSPDPIVRATTHLTVSKNRFCGRTGPAGELLFDPVTYTLSEFTGISDAILNS
jgi:twinkle protein